MKPINRRDFMKKAGWGSLAVGGLWKNLAARTRYILGWKQTIDSSTSALGQPEEFDLGTVAITGPKSSQVCTYGTWTISYTAGKSGIKSGGGIRIGVRHMNHHWTHIQDSNPKGDGFVSVKSSPEIPVTLLVECNNWSKKFFKEYHPVQNIVEIIVGDPGLKPGQVLYITYGDTSYGSQGMQLQPFDEQNYIFKTFVDVSGDGDFLLIENSPSIQIVGAEPVKLAVVLSSNAVKGIPVTCITRAEDRFGNPAPDYTGIIRLSSSDMSAKLPPSYSFEKKNKGVHRLGGIVFHSEGIQSVTVTDGRLSAQSNPVSVSSPKPDYLHLWGDLHGHTAFSDGRGTVEEYYRFARDFAGLDFCSVTDHAFEMTQDMWRECKAVTNRMNHPGHFITFNAFEWSGFSDVGGDHNVYWLDEDPPIYRSSSYYSPKNIQMDHDMQSKVNHITDLYAKLRGHLHDKNVFCIPHRGGRPANPQWHDPEIERLIEVYCEHFRSQEWADEFLQMGYKLGIMASSDDHYGNPGYGFLVPRRQKFINEGLIAVLAAERARQSIFRAMYDRRCYATTGDRIILDFRSDGRLMGSEYKTMTAPEIWVSVVGTTEITSLTIRKNGIPAYIFESHKRSVELSWKDPLFDPGSGCYYDVQVVQQNGEEAFSSPIWIN